MLRFLVWATIVVGALVGIARATVLRWWRIPTEDPALAASITPTLEAGDLVLVWRASAPAFGSLAICPDPEDPSLLVIGRIAAEPGDALEIEGDNVKVNDARAQTESACSERVFTVIDPDTENEVEQFCSIESMGGTAHMRGDWLKGQTPQKLEFDVGEQQIFLLSDNRAYAYDSRDYGTVDRDTCTEAIFFRLVSRRGFLDVKRRLTYIR